MMLFDYNVVCLMKGLAMAISTKPTTVRFDEASKNQAIEILDSIGLSFNSYLNLAVKQLVNKRRVPFELEAVELSPTEETRRAMVEAEAKELGLIPDDSPSFSNASDALAFLRD